MKKSILILGLALTIPTLSAFAAAPRGKGGPGGPPHPGPNEDGDRKGEVHDDPHRNPIFHALLKAIDADDDGIISMTEMNHASEALLKLDQNGDGKLSNEELVSQKDPKDPKNCPPGQKPEKGEKQGEDKGEKPKKKDDQDGAKGDKGDTQPSSTDEDKKPNNDQKSNPPRKDEQLAALVDAIDTNHDGQISAEEIANASHNLKKLDLNHDGKLTGSEYSKHVHQ